MAYWMTLLREAWPLVLLFMVVAGYYAVKLAGHDGTPVTSEEKRVTDEALENYW